MLTGEPHQRRILLLITACILASALLLAQAVVVTASEGVDSAETIQALREQGVTVTTDSITGIARFVRAADGTIPTTAARNATPQTKATAFLAQYGTAFSITDPNAQLRLVDATVDVYGNARVSHEQMHLGVPVYGTFLHTHFNADGDVIGANGTLVPNIKVDMDVRISAETAATIATSPNARAKTPHDSQQHLNHFHTPAATPTVKRSRLVIYRDGLVAGYAGKDYLAYEIEAVGNNARALIYVDAHYGDIIERIDLIHTALDRKVYNGGYGNAFVVWQEGDPLPYVGWSAVQTDNINRIITATAHTYNLFYSVSGGSYDSYDGNGATMEVVNNDPSIACPNANWNGTSTNYCNGVTGDDTVAHEWAHAYTEYTHNLIYSMQPGAINEAYSDIFGEVVDIVNGQGTDAPNVLRAPNQCSIYGGSTPAQLLVNSPPSLAGTLPVGSAVWNAPNQIITGNIVVGLDGDDEGGSASVQDGCQPFTNAAAVNGNVALVDRGTCTFATKATNAQAAGATALVIANNVASGIFDPGGLASLPTFMVSQADGATIADSLPVNVTLQTAGAGTDDSIRWLSGEDDPAFGGAIRDMWNPTCYGDPGRVLDEENYHCDTSDAGGVHINSGIPNHGFALLVDGGTFNGQTMSGIGLTKAAAIYWRSMSVYQGPTTKFADHADALIASCADLVGQDIYELKTDAAVANVSAEKITSADCSQIPKIIDAIELRESPTFCGFEPLLQSPAPAACNDPNAVPIFSEDFSADPSWTITNTGVFAEYNPRDWVHVTTMPAGRTGGLFGIDSINIGNCTPGSDDQSGVMYVETPPITVPTASAVDDRFVVQIDHFIQTEAEYDGGIIQYSIAGAAYQDVPDSAFIFNPHNMTLAMAPANTNPLQGRRAFSGADGGEVVSSWGQSQIDMTALGASVGDTVRLRFALGVDGCNGNDGWYLDQVEAYMCQAPQAAITVPTASVQAAQATDSTTSSALVVENSGLSQLSCNVFDGTVWEQPATSSTGFYSVYEVDTTAGAYGADDFSLDVAMSIDEISVEGFLLNVPTNTLDIAGALNWLIYPDASGEPAGHPNTNDGAEIWSFSAPPSGAGVSYTGGNVTLDLAAAGQTLTLPAGDYWLSFYPDINLAIAGEDYYWMRADEQGYPSQFSDQGFFSSLPDNSWLDSKLVLNETTWDLAFSIDGTATGCDAIDDIPWLSVPDACGPIAAGGSQSVPFEFDSSGLAEGVYTANVCVFNDGVNGQPFVSVPVTLTVEAATPDVDLVTTVGTDPATCAPSNTVAVPPGTTVYYCYTATNNGNATLNLHEVNDSILGNVISPALSFALDPGESVSSIVAGEVVSATVSEHIESTVTWEAARDSSGALAATATATATVIAMLPPTSVLFAGADGAASSSSVWMALALTGVITSVGALVMLLRRR